MTDTSLHVPDARDGLCVVERRILRVMNRTTQPAERPYARSSAIVGEVRQRFPGQGWRSAYDSLVRMTQDFMLRHPLIDGQGNFGSIDGDPAAAPSYTEARLTDFGAAMLSDDRRESVSEAGLGEPDALPSSVPNLLVNGSWTTATNIPPHNLREVVSALIHLIDHPDATASDLRRHIRGPDFPTGACIQGMDGIRDYQETGRAQLVVRARAEVETSGSVTQIVVDEVPFHTDASALIESIANALRDRTIEGVRDLRNESGRDGLRIVIAPKPGVDPHGLLNSLYERTPMQSTMTVALVAMVPNAETDRLAPRTVTLKELLGHYIAHRDACLARETNAGGAASKPERMRLLKEQLTRIAATFGDERRTEIVEA